MAELLIPDAVERDDLGVFVARAVRLDGGALVRLRSGSTHLHAWVDTPFDALVTRSVRGAVRPADLTIRGTDLLSAMAVSADTVVDPGGRQDILWRCALPPERGWREVDQVPAEILAGLAEQGACLAKENHRSPPSALLDQKVITVSGAGFDVGVPMRCLFALCGMGFVGRQAATETAGSSSKSCRGDHLLP
ncbi:MAG TPA: hypothetical protein VFN75_02550 [Pseudonocardiaceae bacterium]|nr:hypothetical protein [Pseudonocardiaceae bacterium]